MTLPRRALTINFERSVSAGVPNTMEVSVAPLAEPSAPGADVTLVGGTQTQVVLLDNEVTPVVFQLVPTDAPGLSGRVLYRVAWRERYLGRQFVRDFVMPDADVSFADLEDLGAIIGGETYVQWSDRGQPGGVAGLNSLGQVIDGAGNPVGSPDTTVADLLSAGPGISITPTETTDGYTAYEVSTAPGVARIWSGPVIPASGSFGAVDHGLGTLDVVATFRRADTRDSVTPVGWKPANADTVAVMFDSPPEPGEYWAVVVG